jgi:DNA-binding MarR family transcriptional regulator
LKNKEKEMKKFKREYRLSKVEFIKFQLDQSINHTSTKLTNTDLIILTYVYLYNLDCHKRLLEDRILTNPNSVINYLAKLTRAGYIVKEEDTTDVKHRGKRAYSSIKLNPSIMLTEEDFIQVSVVTLDESSDKVYHPNFRR